MASTVPLNEFPVWGLLPRKETGAVNLISKYPTYDGRGVVIAVFDSGVDPGAPGLQVTTEGEVKVIDRIDASGAGDIDTSTVVEAVDCTITGLTGRTLKIPDTWVNPSGKYHIGVKGALHMYPKRLRDRLVKEWKEKKWDPFHKRVLADAQKNFQAVDSKSGSCSTVNNSCSNTGSTNNSGNASPEGKVKPMEKCVGSSNGNNSVSFLEKLTKDDAEARVAQLNTIEKKFIDLGPSYDCVVYHDGEIWRACIDTSECGELSLGVTLGEYIHTHEWSALTQEDHYSVSINVHNEGHILEVVGMGSSHGTHVASIAAANFPDTPEKNGVAPGAKIVSIMIGDNRINVMETGTALVRAMTRVMENPYYKVDIVNMSYGEHSHWSNSGRLGDLAHEVVNKYGVMFITSAGNHGPALATVGVPPDFHSDSLIGVGAYVSPDMMMAEYVMLEKLPGCPFTWSSRGPTPDGGRGVSVCAPGAAITSVPTYTLRNSQLMNGTSMASPNAAGCVGLLLSSLKQLKIPYTPYSVRRAVQNTAQHLDIDPMAQGHGLIQVEKAFDHLTKHSGGIVDKVRFSIECGVERSKGIHMRNWLADKPVDVVVNVDPIMLDDLRADPADKLSFNMELIMLSDVPWARVPPCLHLSYISRGFMVSIDPRGLVRGQCYFTCIKAYIAGQQELGPVFEVPITIVVPQLQLEYGYQFSSTPELYKVGQIRRHFLYVPVGATWATCELNASCAEKVQRFIIHAVQLKKACNVKNLEFYKVINLSQNESTTVTFAVRGDHTLEICVARWWACLVDGELGFNVQFHSLQPSQEEITLMCSDCVQRVDVRSTLRSEELSPQAVLKQHAQVLMPVESKVEVLGGARDTIPGGRPIYQLVLTYNLSVSIKPIEATPKCSLLNDVLYESAYESQLWMMFDNNKQMIAAGDAYSSNYTVKLDKGDYTIRLHVRHERSELLDKLSDLPLTILTRLSQEVKLDVYSSFNAAVSCGKKLLSVSLPAGTVQPIYLTAPNLTDKMFKSLGLSPGHSLLGTISFAKDDQVRKATSSHKFGTICTMPDQYLLRVVVTEMPSKKRSSSNSDDRKELKAYTDFQDALKDLQTSWITKLDNDSSEKLYQELVSSNPDHLAGHLARIQALDASDPSNRLTIINIAKHITSLVDLLPLLAFYGTKTDTRPDASKIKTQMDKQKNILIETLARHGSSFCTDLLLLPSEERPQEAYEVLDQLAIDILKFVEPIDTKVSGFFASYYQVRGFDGLAVRLLYRLCDEKGTKENEAKLVAAYKRLDWTHVSDLITSAHPLKFPHRYSLF